MLFFCHKNQHVTAEKMLLPNKQKIVKNRKKNSHDLKIEMDTENVHKLLSNHTLLMKICAEHIGGMLFAKKNNFPIKYIDYPKQFSFLIVFIGSQLYLKI